MEKVELKGSQQVKTRYNKDGITVNFGIVIVSLNWYRPKDPRLSLGSVILATYLKNHASYDPKGYIKLINCDVRDNIAFLIHELLVLKPKLLGFSVYCWNSVAVKQVLSNLRELGYEGTIVLGGSEITYQNPSEFIGQFSKADYFIRGDGEEALVSIVNALVRDKTPIGDGIYDSHGDLLGENELAQCSEIFSPFRRYTDQLVSSDFVRWQTQRGCPYKCSFCAFSNKSSKVQYLSMKDVLRDLQIFRDNNVKEIAILDPVFFLNKKRAYKILHMIYSIIPKTRVEIQTRLEHLDDHFVEQLNKMYVVLEAGIQSFDPEVQKAIGRLNNKTRILTIIRNMKMNNILLETHLIFGLPQQDFISFISDLKTLVQEGVPIIRVFPLNLLNGTALARDEVFRTESLFVSSFPPEVIATQWMSKREIFFIKTKIRKWLEVYNSKINWKDSADPWIREIQDLYNFAKEELPVGKLSTNSNLSLTLPSYLI